MLMWLISPHGHSATYIALPRSTFRMTKTRLNLEALREVFAHLCSPSYEAQGRRRPSSQEVHRALRRR